MKKVFKYIFFFVFFLLFNLIISPLNLDEVWSYGFSYNIYKGLIPYKDFNMVITPFYPLIMSLFSSNMLFFHIGNSLVITFFIYICDKLLKDKRYLILPFLIFPLNITFPNYNFLILFLFILLIYFEKENRNDYIIGIIISFIFLTKQTVGLPLLLVSLYYFKDKMKLLKRFIGFIIPNIIFTIYLLVTNSFREFIDLCFLGLFDFGKSNGNLFTIFFFMIIGLLIILIVLIKKHYKRIDYYYLLMFTSICLPLFDLYHFNIYLISFLIIILLNYDFKIVNYKLIGISLFIGFSFIYIINSNFDYRVYPNKFNLFKYRYISSSNIKFNENVLKYCDKYDNKVMFIGPDGYYFKLINGERLGYMDLINSGNFGYNGSNKLLKYVKSMDSNYVYFVRSDELGFGKQTDQNLIKYILKNGKKIDQVEIYDIYRLGGKND